MQGLLRDWNYGLRAMARNPGTACVALLALALGIGANTAIFSVVNAVLLRPLPYRDESRLVQVWGSNAKENVSAHNVSYADVVDLRKQSRSLEAIAAATPAPMNLTSADEPERLAAWRVNANFFPVLGARFLYGHAFTPEEDVPGSAKVAILTHALWQRRFGSDPNLPGRTIGLDGNSYTVIGILSRDFQLVGRTVDLFVPLAAETARNLQSASTSVQTYARLKPGVTIPQAQAEMNVIGKRLAEQFPQTLVKDPRVWTLRDFASRDVRPSLIVLMWAVALVLLIACVNVANVLLARAGARQREIAIRTAMGAARSRLVRQLLNESTLLALAGGALGLLLAYAGVRVLVLLNPGGYPFLKEASIDGAVLLYTLLLSLATAVVFGMAPALACSRSRALHEQLKEGGRAGSEGRSSNRLRSALVVAEVSLALLLLACAGLAIQSFQRLRQTNPGFNPKGVLTAGVTLPQARYGKPPQRVAFFRELLQRVEAIPGVQSAGIVSSLPLARSNNGTGMFVEGRPIPRPHEIPIIWFRITNADYFRAMQIPLRRGRLFTDQDTGPPPVAIINETCARRFWPGEDPIGKHFATAAPRPGQPVSWITVIGIAGDLHHMGLAKEPDAEVFWPYTQPPIPAVSLVVRTASEADPAAMAPALRSAVLAIDRQLPLSQIRTMEQIVAESIAPQRLTAILSGIFAGIALILAAVGVYGVISFSVTQRTHEIGIRMALGARSGAVLGMIVRQAAALALAGIAIGMAATLALGRVMRSILYGISPTDPLVLASVSVLLFSVAVLAAYIPARRAAGVEPLIALRYE